MYKWTNAYDANDLERIIKDCQEELIRIQSANNKMTEEGIAAKEGDGSRIAFPKPSLPLKDLANLESTPELGSFAGYHLYSRTGNFTYTEEDRQRDLEMELAFPTIHCS